MHQSSETIGAIAAALAKAQGELSNPEKSLTATISGPGPWGGDRTFRYAPLSSGLEIVRKSLGRYEIAAVQTTAIDSEAGLVRLTTVLAHSSGEWISSEWPVCPLAETANPHRMGAALAYARRYALFTLVGIAGEDDVDVPEGLSAAHDAGSVLPDMARPSRDELVRASTPPNRTSPRSIAHQPLPTLKTSESAEMREDLIKALEGISSAEQLTDWVYRQLPMKNRLTIDDARVLEDRFRARRDAISEPAFQEHPGRRPRAQNSSRNAGSGKETLRAIGEKAGDLAKLGGNDNWQAAPLLFGEPRRQRDKAHLKLVASKACLVCGREPADPHHLRYAQPKALSCKVGDEFTVPLCRSHHREVHRCHEERSWWKKYGIDPLSVAAALWAQTRPLQLARQRSKREQVTQASEKTPQDCETKPNATVPVV